MGGEQDGAALPCATEVLVDPGAPKVGKIMSTSTDAAGSTGTEYGGLSKGSSLLSGQRGHSYLEPKRPIEGDA